MGLCRNHPKRCKYCVFCNYWISDIKLKFINSTVGYEYEQNADGKCVKKNNSTRAYSSCPKFEPSADAKKLL